MTTASENNQQSAQAGLQKFTNFITKFFTVWVVLFALAAFFVPGPFLPLGKIVPYLLGFVMLGMGLTMTPLDFKLVLTRPKDVVFGIVARCVIMPGVAYVITQVLDMPTELAVGLILVAACPSGTASNVMTFIAKGDTALSITVSSLMTILAPILTPFIFLHLAGSMIPINAYALLKDILVVVLVPVVTGTLIRYFFDKQVEKIRPLIPILSVISIILIISAVTAGNAGRLASVAMIGFVAVFLHNSFGLGLGYWSARAFGMNRYKSKAICFEIGMENSGLAVALVAMASFDPMVAVPGAIFSIWHNISGSLLASYWGSKDKDYVHEPASGGAIKEAGAS